MTPVWERKSFGAEETFAEDVMDREFLLRYLEDCAARVFGLTQRESKKARTVTLKIKYFDFQNITRSVTHDGFLASADDVFRTVCDLLARTEAGVRPIRLAGISLSTFSEKRPAAPPPNGASRFEKAPPIVRPITPRRLPIDIGKRPFYNSERGEMRCNGERG